MNLILRKHRIYVVIVILFFVVLLLKTAWVSDDAYITFRTIENFIHGYGLVHNVGERVQTYSHPLWFLILSGINFFFQKVLQLDYWSQMYYSNLFISIFISITTIILISFLIAKSARGAILALIVLISSKAFMDYSTSGLENPLTHFLFAFFLYVYFSNRWSNDKKLLLLSFVASLGALNRLDSILIYLPPLLFVYLNQKLNLKGLLIIILGFTPMILWEVFSLYYYGMLFPNTAYAKLSTGINRVELITQGFYYFVDSIREDPITLLCIFGVIIFTMVKKQSKMIVVTAGILLYMGYILMIGGDFMSGRFFSSCIMAAAVLLSQISFDEKQTVYGVVVVLVLALGLINITSPLRTPKSDGGNVKEFIKSHGISDESGYYYDRLGLLSPERENEILGSKYSGKDWIYNAAEKQVKFIGPLGIDGYSYGPNVHVIDKNALSDPLLSRLPITDTDHWRIGHFSRQAPEGYLDTLAMDENKIHNENLAAYYDKLKFIVRGDLLNKDRLKEIIRFNTGEYDPLIEAYMLSEDK